MSDNATLIARLNGMTVGPDGVSTPRDAAARIAELEASLASWQKQASTMEAERDKLRFALECIAAGETSNPVEMAAAAIRARPAP